MIPAALTVAAWFIYAGWLCAWEHFTDWLAKPPAD